MVLRHRIPQNLTTAKQKRTYNPGHIRIGRSFFSLLFMVFAPGEDAERAVGGFQEQDAHELVREGQPGDRQAQVACRFDFRGKTVGGADDKADCAVRLADLREL